MKPVECLVCAAMAMCQFTDNFVFSLPLAFVPQQLEALDYNGMDIAILVGAFAWANQLSFVAITVLLLRFRATPNFQQEVRYLLVASYVHFVSTLTLAMFPWYACITACRFLQGAVSPVISVYGLTVVAQHFGDHSRALGLALVIAGSCGGELLGSFAGGYFFSLGGLRLPFYVTTCMALVNFLLVAAVLLFVRPGPEGLGFSAETAKSEDKVVVERASGSSSLGALLRDKFVVASCLCVFAAQALKMALEIILPLFLQNQLGANEMIVSAFYAILAVAFVASSVAHGYAFDRGVLTPARSIPPNLALLAVSAAGAVYGTDIRAIVLSLVLFGGGLGGTLSPCCDALLAYCAKHPQLSGIGEAVVVALFNDFWAAGLVLGAYGAGVPNEFDRFAQRQLLVVSGAVVLAVAAGFAQVTPAATSK